ncbi:hypothetical protein H9659_08140 [Sporosarcina sp. Sa3CUA8]|uniref:Lipoprotein n=2 Tax=Sporosarcina gallistercoris TaxID=2762245 RepID=A0ABR8PJD1_9BACL|nr:hypothetical protein [Sporosarcina gallistercoris]
MIVAGCSEQGVATEGKETKTETAPTTEHSVEANIKTIEAVLEQELNGPDEEYVQLVNAAMGGTEDMGSVKQKEDEMRLTSYIKEKYLPYFTEDGLLRAESIGMLFQYQYFYDFEKEYQLRLVDSEVKQSDIDTASNQYFIKATVEFSAPGEEPSLHELEGKAIFSTKEGKIGNFQLGQKDPTLSKKISNLGEGE